MISWQVEKTSLLAISKIVVTQHAKCRIRVEVLLESSSGGFKFKISNVIIAYEQLEGALMS